MSDPGLSVYFMVQIDAGALGAWQTCHGLGMEIETEVRLEGNLSLYQHQLPGRYKYPNLTLGRPICPDTAKVMAWLSTFVGSIVPTSAEVTACSPSGQPIMSWSLFGVVPVRWTGPSFDAASLQPATETLELAYGGFL